MLDDVLLTRCSGFIILGHTISCIEVSDWTAVERVSHLDHYKDACISSDTAIPAQLPPLNPGEIGYESILQLLFVIP